MSILISCEVGGQRVPSWLVGSGAAISSQSDPPAKKRSESSIDQLSASDLPMRMPGDEAAQYVALRMSDRLRAPLFQNHYSPQLIDVTRSETHRRLFPLGTRSWPDATKRRLIDEVHRPYRESVQSAISERLRRDSYVVHLSVRTFERFHKGKPRRADVGLLYDPSSNDEVDFCLDWIDEMYDDAPMLKVRRNYPRRGTTESLTKSMRSTYSGQNYLGIEVLLNRAWASREVRLRDEAIDGMCQSLGSLLHLGQTDAA